MPTKIKTTIKPKKVKKEKVPAKHEEKVVVVKLKETSLESGLERIPKENGTREKYYQSNGRRKESVARVRLYTKKSTDTIESEKALIIVNGKDYRDYFLDVNLRNIVEAALRKLKSLNRFKATVVVHGGGLRGQADAIKHGLARALVLFDVNFRKKLKKGGFLTRDSRVKERRKYGLKKARKRGQWQKR